MPAKKNTYRFQMDTETFCVIWRNHVAHPQADNWSRFVLALFERFSRDSEEININSLNSNPETKNWKDWNDDQKHVFLSEKAYTKCMNIRKRMREDYGGEIPMPSGYLDRKGKTGSGRISDDEIAAIFGLKKKS
jgi:hypothetical protein